MLEKIFVSVVITSFIGTLLCFVLLLFKPITRKVFSASWNYYIWLFVLVVMILPLRITLPEKNNELPETSPIKVQAQGIEAEEVLQIPFDADIEITEAVTSTDTEAAAVEADLKKTKAVDISDAVISVASATWVIIAFVIFGLKLFRYFLYVGQTQKTSQPVVIPEIELKRISVRVSDSIYSPLMTGVFKPVLLLPNTTLSEKQLKNVILHETLHFKRCDVLVKWFSLIVKSIHFFNPAVYLICRQLDEECEISCDASVVKDMSREDEISYVNTIIALLSERSSKSVPLTTGMAGDKKTLKKRFLLIKNKKRTGKKAVFASVVIALVLIVTALLFGGILNGFIVKEEKKTNAKASLSEIAVDMPLNLEAESGVGVEIAFESEDTLVFYGDFGLFVYDLTASEMKLSVDFEKAIGIVGSVQGSYGTAVDVSEDGNTVVISEYTAETETRGKTCYIDISSLTYEHGEYEPPENTFDKENIKGFIYPGIKISQIKYVLNDKEWSLFDDNYNDYHQSSVKAASEYSLSRRFVDEVYNIQLAAEVVGKEKRDDWVNNVFLKKSREEQNALPTLYQMIVDLDISKEELIRKNNEYIDYPDQYIPAHIIDSLYKDDIDTVKQELMNPLALYFDGEIYTFDELSKNTDKINIPQDVLQEYFDYIDRVFSTVDTAQCREIIMNALDNKGLIYDTDTHREMYINDYLNSQGLRMLRYSTVDLDGDSGHEGVVWLSRETNDYWGFLVLHLDGDKVYAHELTYRAFYELKADGTFCYSAGVSDHGVGRMEFESDAYKLKRLAYSESEYGTQTLSYYIDGKATTKEAFELYEAEQSEKPDAVWNEAE